MPGTATDVLMTAMEEFGKSEPRHVLVIYSDEGGDLVRLSNADLATQAGFCRCAEAMVMRKFLKDSEG